MPGSVLKRQGTWKVRIPLPKWLIADGVASGPTVTWTESRDFPPSQIAEKAVTPRTRNATV